MSNASIRPSGAQKTDYIIITAPMLAAFQATLSATPVAPINALVEAGGVAQKYSSDFIITGNVISWLSMGLGTILSVGDILMVQYYYL